MRLVMLVSSYNAQSFESNFDLLLKACRSIRNWRVFTNATPIFYGESV